MTAKFRDQRGDTGVRTLCRSGLEVLCCLTVNEPSHSIGEENIDLLRLD